MNDEKRYFDSRYIIDGVEMQLTPSQLLGGSGGEDSLEAGLIVDETLDPLIRAFDFAPSEIFRYLSQLRSCRDFSIEPSLSGPLSQAVLLADIIDAMWTEGPFKLENLVVEPHWKWRDEGVGSMAAFYRSVEAVAQTADDLMLRCRNQSVQEGAPSLHFGIPGRGERLLGERFIEKEDSWIIYVPFSTAAFRLGGSTLSHALSAKGGSAPVFEDPDYFIDCCELVREFAEDGVALAAKTVFRGGLLASLDEMCQGGIDVEADISDLVKAYPSCKQVEILFGEVPGALIQISDDDFDYLDAEFILQDVMYFPLGHASKGSGEVSVRYSADSTISGILSALVR